MKTFILDAIMAVSLLFHEPIEPERPALVINERQVTCLAQNIYHEARGESFEGQTAIAYVTLNRVQAENWGDTICDVVYEPHQFSWTSRKDLQKIQDPAAFENAMMAAVNAIAGVSKDPTNGATYYFNHSRVRPVWAKDMRTTAVIGGHTFKRGRDE